MGARHLVESHRQEWSCVSAMLHAYHTSRLLVGILLILWPCASNAASITISCLDAWRKPFVDHSIVWRCSNRCVLGRCTKRWNEVIVICRKLHHSWIMHPAKQSKPSSTQHLRLILDKADCIIIFASVQPGQPRLVGAHSAMTVWSVPSARRMRPLPCYHFWKYDHSANCRIAEIPNAQTFIQHASPTGLESAPQILHVHTVWSMAQKFVNITQCSFTW